MYLHVLAALIPCCLLTIFMQAVPKANFQIHFRTVNTVQAWMEFPMAVKVQDNWSITKCTGDRGKNYSTLCLASSKQQDSSVSFSLSYDYTRKKMEKLRQF